MEIGRRGFLYLAGNAIVAWALSAQSQQGSNLPTVAVLLPASPEFAKIRVDAIRKGLGETGLVEGAHYVIALRFADGQSLAWTGEGIAIAQPFSVRCSRKPRCNP